MAPITIRDGTREDCYTMASIWGVAYAARRQQAPPDAPTPETLELIYKRSEDKSTWLFVAEDHGHSVGAALALQARKQDQTNAIIPGLLHISMVSVLPQFWGQGIGSMLMRQILTKARRRYSHAQLYTQLTNVRAHELYTRFGFTPTGERKLDDHGEEIQLYVIPLD